MARPKKEGKPVSLMMEISLFNELENYCEKTYLSKTAVIEMALKQLFDEKEKNQNMIQSND
ncbi:MAG: hypothetical protein K6E27_08830 [Eubacterium sp.]|nr:hypothetical protein [Eubacterium sp.]